MTQKRYVVRHGGEDTLNRCFDKEHLKPRFPTSSGSKVMAQTVVFMFLVTLTLTFDLCSIFFVTRTGHDVLGSPCKVS